MLALLAGPLAAGATRADPAPLPVVEIAPGTYVHQGRHEEAAPGNAGDIANIGFVVGEEAVAVIDSGGSAAVGAALLAAIRQVTDRPVRWVVNTHVHPDHLLGNAAFRAEGARFVGHANLPRALAARGAFYLERLRETLGAAAEGSTAIPPDVTVADSLTLELGGRRLVLTAWPPAHTDADLTVHDPAGGTLWTGDLLFMERAPVIDGSLNGWLEVMARLRDLPAERVVPGHGPPAALWPQALDAQEAYLRGLRDALRGILAAGGTIEQALATAGRDQAGAWLLFEATNARNVVTAFTELEWE
ncbi:MAG: quinoprotein relay system zinc metallohydrolase 2 [Tistlia sp.]|uniref:quinoprotein relay system zinc metallohydrolase 2 n=1 Tax=Tistlia sp. TaxID=3057121 RepID=UPI0034A43E91